MAGTTTFQREQFERLCRQLKEGIVNDVCISNLRYGTFTDAMLSKLFECSSSFRKLQFNVPLSNSMLIKLASKLKNCQRLLFLGLDYCDESIIQFFKAAGYLSVKTIQITFVKHFVLDKEGEAVVLNFFEASDLTDVRLALGEELRLWDSRQHVSLLECLVAGLAKNTSLKVLDLKLVDGSDLSRDSMELLFQRNICMLQFNVSAMDSLKDHFVRDFLSALNSSAIPRDICLKHLTSEASAALFEGLATTTKIRSLSTEKLEYGHHDLQTLSDGLDKNSSIRKLTLAAICGGAHTTLQALAPILSSHRSLLSFQLFGHCEALSSDIVPTVEKIVETNHRIIEFGFPIFTANDANHLLHLIPRFSSVESLHIVDGSSSTPLINPEELLEALNENCTLLQYSYFSPEQNHIDRLNAILQRNIQLKRRRKLSMAIPQLERSPQLWPLLHAKMSNRDDWLDAIYHLTRELVMLQR